MTYCYLTTLKSNSAFLMFLRRALRCLARWIGIGVPYRCRPTENKTVLLAGGYGYGNLGDEAQLDSNLRFWREHFGSVEHIVLSPNPVYTAKLHKCKSILASRCVFFKSNIRPHYARSDKVFIFQFILIWCRMLFNAHLMRAGIAPMWTSIEEAKLLLSIQSASLLHICGGGFLTGETKSRLWDSSLLMILSYVLGTPYILTGQTIACLKTRMDRWLIRQALINAKYISVRDPKRSKLTLRSLEIRKEAADQTYDDAILCRKADSGSAELLLTKLVGLNRTAFIAINFHYWAKSAVENERIKRRMAEICLFIVERLECDVLLVPMLRSDCESGRHLKLEVGNEKIYELPYVDDFSMVRAILATAQMLISFKHHPLVFSLGEGVPSVSVALDEYYNHKNEGAMANYGQEKYCITNQSFYTTVFEETIKDVFENRVKIKDNLMQFHQLANDKVTEAQNQLQVLIHDLLLDREKLRYL